MAASKYFPLLNFLLLLGLFAVGCFASFEPTSPPNTLVFEYPTGPVDAGSTMTLGVLGSTLPQQLYYAFSWIISLSIVLPNGTHVGSVGISTPSVCSSSATSPSRGSFGEVVAFSVYNETGTYTPIWNVTYGTTNDSDHCDSSTVSYQSWLVNVTSVHVIESRNPSTTVSVPLTSSTATLVPAPTGTIFVSNSAHATATSSSALATGLVQRVMAQVL